MRFTFPGRRRAALLAGFMTAALVGVALAGTLRHDEPQTTPLAPPPPGSLRAVPAFKHIYVIVLENKRAGQLIGDPAAPYFNRLLGQYGSADAYQGVAHPSQPNYLALVSGSTHGVTDNSQHDLTAPTVFDQVESVGRSWRVYAENVPAGCYTGMQASGGRDGDGNYARRHEPAISFTGISTSPTRCANIQDLSSFDPAAADLELIVPNLCHDMHDCSVAAGDAWLSTFVPRILGSAPFQDGGALFITFDEDEGSMNVGNQVATLVVAPGLAAQRSSVPHNHYSLLRTIQEAWHLGCLAESCAANTLGEFFR